MEINDYDPDSLLWKLLPEDQKLITQLLARQGATSKEEKTNFTRAYALGRYLAEVQGRRRMSKRDTALLVFRLSYLAYPHENSSGLREVQLRHHKTGAVIGTAPGRVLQGALEDWCGRFATGKVSAVDSYFEFVEISPFLKGNGLVGYLMWATDVYRRTTQWPLTLPPQHQPS